jgi:carbonic anhydrase
MGHSACGGVKLCHDICTGKTDADANKTSFVARWIDILKPGFDRIQHSASNQEQITQLEKEGVVISLENLMTFPFIQDAVAAGSLSLHGLWNDIGDGGLEVFDGKLSQFVKI